MSWEKLLADRHVKSHTTSLSEMIQLRDVVARDISDGQVPALSLDRRFACFYSAALQLTHMIIACAGYRIATGSGHHKISFESLELAIGPTIRPYAVYFDVCRRKRNVVEYDSSSVVTKTELNEMFTKVLEFEKIAEQWITVNYPELSQ